MKTRIRRIVAGALTGGAVIAFSATHAPPASDSNNVQAKVKGPQFPKSW